jgi:CheY-like chemotaxis protein
MSPSRFVAPASVSGYAFKRLNRLSKRARMLYEPTVDNTSDVGAILIRSIPSDVNVVIPLAQLRPTVLLADDHNGFLDRLCKLLSRDFDVLGTVSNGRDAVSKAVYWRPDVIVLDVSMPELNGLEAVLEMRKMGVSSKLLFLTVHESSDYVSRAFENGADAFIFKSRMNSELLLAIRKVLAGGTFVSTKENLRIC